MATIGSPLSRSGVDVVGALRVGFGLVWNPIKRTEKKNPASTLMPKKRGVVLFSRGSVNIEDPRYGWTYTRRFGLFGR